jgi:hypothetical protein
MTENAVLTPFPVTAAVTRRDLENFFYQRGADVLAITERHGYVEVNWWPVPSVPVVIDTLSAHTAGGVVYNFRLRSRWWAAWRLLTYSARVLFRGTLR